MFKSIKEMTEVMEHFDKGGKVERVERGYDDWVIADNPMWNWNDYEFRIKEFQYPMWFKDISNGMTIKFDGLQSGTVVETGDAPYKKGEYRNTWVSHTDDRYWEEIEEPKEKPKQKVKIEKWLIEDSDIKFVVETSDIDSWLEPFPTAKKLKLIQSYEVEI